MHKILTALLTSVIVFTGTAPAQETFPVIGLRDKRHTVYALTHATLFVDYKTRIDSATILVRDEKIEQAGKNISIPGGAVVIDLKGKHVYPSFIDLYSDYGIAEVKRERKEGSQPQFQSATKGAYHWNQAVKPETEAHKLFSADSKKAESLRNNGWGTVLTHQQDGIARGTATLVALSDENENEIILKEKGAAFYSFDKGSSTQEYPGSLMGCIALIRQTYYDAQWYKQNDEEKNISLEAWNNNQSLPQVFTVNDRLSLLRAVKIGDEFKVRYIIKSNGDEYQRVDEIKSSGSNLIVPLNFPQAYDVSDPYDAINITMAEMKHWEMAPANLSMLDKAGVSFSVTASGLKEGKDFLPNLRKAVEHGLSRESALKALTVTPASWMGMEKTIGSLKQGMLANFIITSKDIFEKEAVLHENWVKGKRYVIKSLEMKDIHGKYELNMEGLNPLVMKISGDTAAPQVSIEEDTVKVKVTFTRSEPLYTFQFELKRLAVKGAVRLSGYFDDKTFKGNGQLGDGTWIKWSAKYTGRVEETKKDSAKTDTTKKSSPDTGDLLFPNMAYGFKEMPKQETVLIRNVTVWTNEKEGILQNADVLIQNGKIGFIGKNISMEGAKEINGEGLHLTAGIIDEHSHIAISGSVNECTHAITSEVRIGDVVNCDDINIYRQLSGGVTSSHLLHGSCNCIGGQTQLIKLRWGMTPEKMKFENADGFIKFALGENVKQSNWGDNNRIRYPQTRMGVEQTYVDAFSRAKEYKSKWNRFNSLSAKDKLSAKSPKRDLQLDALAEILDKKRFITCHSYQQGEINMLMHVGDSMGFKVNTFTHILEGFKVADKMKQHGAGGSSFADWWAYKYEVIEAIPHNGAIMHNMGVVTAFNSDDGEMARRLNQEAAKAVKYGNISEEEALKFVTLNPAKLLHVDNRTGSIKVGKDADVVLWTDNPLSVYARVVKTFVDGICYYDADRDKELQEYIKKERARLIQKMTEEKSKGSSTQKPSMTLKEEYSCGDH